MSPNLRRVLTSSRPHPGSLGDIRHVVLLMQENRSFDHYFGTLSGVRGFDDPDPLALPNGRPVFYQPDHTNPLGYLLPFHLDTRTSNAQTIPSNFHSWTAQHAAWNHGRMDRWIHAHRWPRHPWRTPYVMGYYERADIPFHYALADLFTVCDAYHCSMLGPTWPNRLYWMSGMIDPQGRLGGPVIWNRRGPGGYRWTTYAERLERAGVSWKVYQQEHDGHLNVLPLFQAFQSATPDSGLYRRGVARGEPDQFERDALADRLPAVSWVIPPFHDSEHPGYLPADGAAFIARKLDAIAARPDVWAKTAVILGYDENDGLFDHVAPPVPPPGTPDEFVHRRPIGAGFRVPCIVISPWTTGGWVCSEPFDHTSVLRFLERWTGVAEPNISAWRRQTFGDLTSAFRFDAADAAAPALPDARADRRRAHYEVEHLPRPRFPGRDQSAPKQEPGPRHHIPPRAR